MFCRRPPGNQREGDFARTASAHKCLRPALLAISVQVLTGCWDPNGRRRLKESCTLEGSWCRQNWTCSDGSQSRNRTEQGNGQESASYCPWFQPIMNHLISFISHVFTASCKMLHFWRHLAGRDIREGPFVMSRRAILQSFVVLQHTVKVTSAIPLIGYRRRLSIHVAVKLSITGS